ncbi:MAG: glycosyltransferase family 2 protein [Prosthecobacter sp.]
MKQREKPETRSFNQATMSAKVQIVIPVHNRREITRRCLDRLVDLEVRKWAGVIVVDDGSADGTSEMIVTYFPWVQLSQGNGDLWWGGAIRLGMEVALGRGADCVCWLNDDSLPEPGSLERLVQLALESSAICGGICRTPDGAFVYSGGLIHHRWPQHLAPVPESIAPVIPVEWLHGNMVAIPAAVCRRIGLPESLWMKHNFADVEYTLRAHRAGVSVLLVPSALGVADRNESVTYWSWADVRLSWLAIMLGFGNPKVWWYMPGLIYFKTSHFGVRGAMDCLCLFGKAILMAFYKCLPNQMLTIINPKIRS